VKTLRYVELKSGHSDNGPTWIGYVMSSKTGRTLYLAIFAQPLEKVKKEPERAGECGKSTFCTRDVSVPIDLRNGLKAMQEPL
jgi:hypothetical protein